MLAVCGGVLLWASRSSGSHSSSRSQREENDKEAAEYLAEAQDILESDGPLAAADYLIAGIEQGYDREALLAMREDIIAHTVITRETGVDSDGDSYEYTWEYDSMGNMTRDGNGNTYEYDSAGNLVRKKNVTSYGVASYIGEWNTVYILDIDSDSDEGEYTYEYDCEGNLVRKMYVRDRYSEEYKYEYDSKGNVIRETNSNGSEYTYEYDSEGNVIRETNSNGNECAYEYDSEGNMIRKTYVDDSYSEEYTFEYDSDGNVVHETLIDSDGNSIEHTLEYDSEGNMVHITYINNDGDNGEGTFEYDSLGNLLSGRETGIVDGEEDFDEYTYEYEYAYYANKKVEQQ